MTLTRASRNRRSRRRVWFLAGTVVFAAAVAVALLAVPRRTHRAVVSRSTAAVPADFALRHRSRPRPQPSTFSERATGTLPSAVQDEAAAPVPGGALLLGGLTASDQSRTDLVVASSRGGRSVGSLPTALHDTAAVRLGDAVYLFGGGTGANTQSDQIWRVPPGGGRATLAGTLPQPSSDQSAVAVGRTAYVVGGYTGVRWLNSIVAWRPGSHARVVAHLPFALRYAAVAAAGTDVVIAGGSLENGTASSAVLRFDTRTRRVTRIGALPAPTTHAAAAALGDVVYVVGGRGAALGTPTDRIVSVEPRSRRIRRAGVLAAPRSDLAAVTIGSRIVLFGGRTASGTDGSIGVLVPVSAAHASRTRTVASADVYAHDAAGALTGAARFAKQLVYVPNSQSDTVDVIDPRTFKVVRHFAVGGLPQHVVPAWNLRTLYVTNDVGNSLTAIDPRTGQPGRTIPVEDPYNMYFTPDGRYAIVVAERLQRLDFRDARTFALRHSLAVSCRGVDHMDFTADGRLLLASCEFSGQLVVVNVAQQRVVRTVALPDGYGGMPQDVKLSPDGRTFYVADMRANGVWKIDADTFRVRGFLATGAGAHGLYPSRDSRFLYVSNREAGTVSVVSFASERVVKTWRIPGGTPDMGGVSSDGKVLWLSGRYRSEVYAISTASGRLLARIPVGAGPHGLCVWPQPGRYSLGHTGILR